MTAGYSPPSRAEAAVSSAATRLTAPHRVNRGVLVGDDAIGGDYEPPTAASKGQAATFWSSRLGEGSAVTAWKSIDGSSADQTGQ